MEDVKKETVARRVARENEDQRRQAKDIAFVIEKWFLKIERVSCKLKFKAI